MTIHKVYRSQDGHRFACALAVGTAREEWEAVTCPDCLARAEPARPLTNDDLARAYDMGRDMERADTVAFLRARVTDTVRSEDDLDYALAVIERGAHRKVSRPAPSSPTFDYVLDGLRHRKWTFPARRHADGGVRGERWVYSVGETPYVVTFTVLTGRYPEGCETLPPRGADECWHRAEVGAGAPSCIYLDGAACRSDGSGLNADEWYEAQPKNAEGFVADADVFAYARDLYAAWSRP